VSSRIKTPWQSVACGTALLKTRFRTLRAGHFRHMSGGLYEIRFPNGEFEIAYTQKHPPDIGDTLQRRGELWRVVSKTIKAPLALRVEPAEEPGGRLVSRAQVRSAACDPRQRHTRAVDSETPLS
jgi:hypothetical protein